jgi:hypothetical protein
MQDAYPALHFIITVGTTDESGMQMAADDRLFQQVFLQYQAKPWDEAHGMTCRLGNEWTDCMLILLLPWSAMVFGMT